MDTHLDRIALATDIAMRHLGTPYKWGGDDPMAGFDCSGFVIEILKSVGILPRKFDTTAQGLYDRFSDRKALTAKAGCLAFWQGSSSKIVHVEFCLDAVLSIGASGGGSRTQSESDAVEQNAYIKIRPMSTRAKLRGFVDPFSNLRG